MSPEQKAKLDNTQESDLWQLLASTPATDPQAIYVRERLAQKSQATANQKLEEISRRLSEMEQSTHRSSLGTPTFWLALLAALFSSFAVPWDDVGDQLETWRQKFNAEWQRPSSRSRSLPSSSPDAPSATRPAHEPALPQNPSATPATASPLFPQ